MSAAGVTITRREERSSPCFPEPAGPPARTGLLRLEMREVVSKLDVRPWGKRSGGPVTMLQDDLRTLALDRLGRTGPR